MGIVLSQYPRGLPMPSSHSVTPTERRTLSDIETGPRQHSTRQRDYLATQRVTWPVLSPAQAAELDQWWRVGLLLGGRWFSAVWPLPRGWEAATRRFISPPEWRYLNTGFWSATAEMEVRGRDVPPRLGPLLAMHFDGDWRDESGDTIKPYNYSPGGGIPEPTISGVAKFGSGAYSGPGYIQQPLLSSNRGELNLNAFGEWQIRCWVRPQVDLTYGGSGGGILSLNAGVTGANGPGDSNGDNDQFVLRAIGDNTQAFMRFDYVIVDPNNGVPTAHILRQVNSPLSDSYPIPVDQWTFIAVVGDATSTRMYINEDLRFDDRTADGAEPPGRRPMRSNPVDPFTNQYFAIGSLNVGSYNGDQVFPADSAWSIGWSGQIDDLQVTQGPGSVDFKGPTIVVPMAPFEDR